MVMNRTDVLNWKGFFAATCAMLLCCVVSVQSATAAILANYEFGVAAHDVTSSDTDTNSVASDISAGAGNGVFASSIGNPTRGSVMGIFDAADEATAITNSDYFAFTITPNALVELDLTTISFDNRRREALPNGPNTYSLYTDAGGDNFTTQIGSGSLGTADISTWTGNSLDLSTTAILQDVTVATTFRVYVYGQTAGLGAPRIDNVQLEGTATVIPEPSSLVVLLLGSVGAVMIRRQR